MRIVALVSAHNEADVLATSLEALVSEGIGVYVIDDGSDDGTAEVAAAFEGRGLVGLEKRPAGQPFSLAALMRRKEELARELDADWFINHDADEFREGPWRGLSLPDSVALVDRLGFDAIDFEVLNFPPTRDLRPGEDVREAFTHFEPGGTFDRLQIRMWRKNKEIDLVTSGGHEAAFPLRRVFPVRFLLRHYPIRGQAHGERKVFGDRRPRFDPDERARGWHVQYDGLAAGHRFLRDPAELTPWDPDLVRARLLLHHRDAEAATARAVAAETENSALQVEHAKTAAWARDLARQLSDAQAAKAAADAWATELERSLESEKAARNELETWARGLAGELEAENRAHAAAADWAHARQAETRAHADRARSVETELTARLEAEQAARHELETWARGLADALQAEKRAHAEAADWARSLEADLKRRDVKK